MILGGLALGLALLSMGGDRPVLRPGDRPPSGVPPLRDGPAGAAERPWYGWWNNPSLLAGSIALGIGLLDRRPWYARMIAAHGREFLAALLNPPDPLGWERPTLLARLNDLAPATLPLALFAVARSVKAALVSERDDRATIGGVFWVLWLAVAALAPALWADGPQTAMSLFLLVPLNLLAAQAISDLASRRVSVRWLSWLAPATAVSVVWWLSGELQGAR